MTRTNELAVRGGVGLVGGIALGIASNWTVQPDPMRWAWLGVIVGVLLINWVVNRRLGKPDAAAFTLQYGVFLVVFVATIIVTGAGPF